MDGGTTSIRGKDWIFNAIWAASAESSGYKCTLNLPVTFIFRDGEPFRGVYSDSGIVKRVSFEEDLERAHGEMGLRGDLYRKYRLVRQRLMDYHTSMGYDSAQTGLAEPYIGKISYADGEEELVSARTFDVLIRNSSWRLQVLLIQGYVPSLVERKGAYFNVTKVRSLLETDGSEAADQLTKSIAKYAENAYKYSSASVIDRKDDGEIKLRVKELRTIFAVDNFERFQFLSTDYVSVEILGSGRKEVEDYLRKEKSARESSAVDSVAIELLSLLQHAQKKGLPMSESFTHFDLHRCGFVDVDALIDGLARLGIGVTYPVGEGLLQMIGGLGATFVTVNDFETFVKSPPDIEVFESDEKKSPFKTPKDRTTVIHTDKQGRTKKVTIPHRLQPVGRGSNVTDDGDDSLVLNYSLRDSQNYEWIDFDGSRRGKKMDSVGRVLPLPEAAYNTGKQNTSSNISNVNGNLNGNGNSSKNNRDGKGSALNNGKGGDGNGNGSELPQWASKRQKRALDELKKSQVNWLKKKESELESIQDDAASFATADDSFLSRNVSSAPGSDTAKSKNNSKKNNKGGNLNLNLNLTTISMDQKRAKDLASSADDVFLVEDGVVMTYRVLVGAGDPNANKTMEQTKDLRYRSILEQRDKNFDMMEMKTDEDGGGGDMNIGENSQSNISENESSGKFDRFVAFTLIVFPDLFSTLDSLNEQLQPILIKFPHARVVLVGLPGLPNTVWPENWVLNSDLHIRCTIKLLHYLKTKRKICNNREEPIFMMGLGFGVFSLAKFGSQVLLALPWLQRQLKCYIFINGILKISKGFLRICKDLRTSMMQAGHHEVSELITSLHFHDSYLAVRGRDKALRAFWKARRGLSSQLEGDSFTGAGSSYIGVLELLRGILMTPDPFDGSEILTSTTPIITVQSTEDVFIDPRNAKHYQSDQLPPERVVVNEIHDALDENAVFVNWLRAGHEVIQERAPYILSLISNLAQICGIKPVDNGKKDSDYYDNDDDDEVAQKNKEEEVFDIMEIMERRKRQKEVERLEKERKEYQEVLDKLEAKRKLEEEKFVEEERERERLEKERIQREKEARDREEERRRQEAQKQLEEELARQKEEEERERIENEKRRERQSQEKERRLQLANERKKREMIAKRKADMEPIYEREMEAKEKKKEMKEREKMNKEDVRSKFAAEYQKYEELVSKSKKISKEKAKLLQDGRREEALKRVEDQMNLERTKRMEERRLKAEALVKQIDSERVFFAGEASGGYDIPEDRKQDVMVVIAATQRLMDDLLHARQESVEALKRQMLVEQKHAMFHRQIDSSELELQRLRRAIRLIEMNPSLVGSQDKADKEINDLKRSIANKEETFLELVSLMKQRQNQLNSSNRKVQELKIISREKNDMLVERIRYMKELEALFETRIRELKMEKEKLIVDKDKFRIKEMITLKRIDTIKREMNRIADVKSDFVDTDVWVEGVLQRVQTVDLRGHLTREIENAYDQLKKIRNQMETARNSIVECGDRISLTRRNCDKVGIAAKAFHRNYLKFSAVPVIEIMKNLAQQHTNAERMEEVRKKDQELKQIATNIHSNDNANETVIKLRLKDFELRTRDERKFLAMDMILHPEEYIHLTTMEAEQMQFDEDYQCELSKSDLDRIIKLPEQVNLAMPFLHNNIEVQAHRLFNMFLRNHDESFFRTQDFMSEGFLGNNQQPSSNASTESSSIFGPSISGKSVLEAHDVQEAEVIHDILMKESLRDRIRSMGEGEAMSVDEREWLQIDKILSPHCFEADEELPTDIHKRNVQVDLSSSVIVLKKLDRITKPKEEDPKSKKKKSKKVTINRNNEGDIYDDLRDRYADDELVFDYSWKCPYNRAQLIEMYERHEELRNDDERRVKRLMDKYYVNENESILGNSRLKLMHEVSREISTAIRKIDETALEDAKETEARAMAELAAKAGNGGDNNNNTATNKIKNKNDDDDGLGIKRIWGSWEQVHPASAGAQSQENYFLISGFNASRDHPASFAIHEEELPKDDFSVSTMESDGREKQKPEGPELLELGIKLLTTHPGSKVKDNQFDEYQNDPNSKWFICESVRELSTIEPRRTRGKVVLIVKKDRLTIFEVKDLMLQSRQSRSHRFQLPDRDDARIIDMSVSVVFQGAFSTKGYKLGRLAASMFRLPDEKDPESNPMPIPVGYAPYDMQSPNLPDVMGRLVILHRPRARPMKPGWFQIVVGSASSTKYSIEVTCRYAQTALPIVDELIVEARQMQGRLPTCLKELEDLSESLRIAERKLLVCSKMMEEAETESSRCLKVMKAIQRKLEADDEEMTMFEDERKEFQRELAIMEVEYAQWATLFASRCRERDDIREGIKMMHNFQRDRQKEKKKLKEDLEVARRDLPACIAVLRSFYEAANVAASLNTIVQGPGASYGMASGGQEAGEPVISTPAEDIRRRVKMEGFKSMTLEEQQWCLLDQALNPQKYEWLREQEEQENEARVSRGKQPKAKKYNAAVEAFRYQKVEIEGLMQTPFSMLTRREMMVRKLLTKYHDNPEIIKKEYAIAAYGFDPHLAERTRSKHQKAYNKEEKEWASLDRVLHPDVWKYYVNKDEGVGYLDVRQDKPNHVTHKAPNGADSVTTGSQSTSQNRLDQNQKDVIDKMGKMLGLEDTLSQDASSLKTDHLDMSELASSVHKKMTKKRAADEPWICPFDKETILKIWRTPRHKLKSEDERTVYKLLLKYNGTYKFYLESIEDSNRRKQNSVQAGSHIRYEAHGKVISNDVDLRARQLLREVDRATFSKNEWMNSDVLHGNDQRFPTRVLRMHLEEALDIMLMEQIKERERADRMKVDSDTDSDDEGMDGEESDLSINGEEGDEKGDLDLVNKIKKRAKRREKLKKKLKQSTEEEEVLKAKKKVVSLKNKSGAALAEAILQNQLGVGGCLACRSNPCKWKPTVDMDICMERKRVLEREIEKVKLDKESTVIESHVSLSAQLGGNTMFKRMDLMEELTTELSELDRRIHLNLVDKELHDAYASRKEYIEVKHLHGYSMMLWTNNARQALEARQSRMVAFVVAKEVVDDILDWMLEGWYFGERESQFNVMGYVPTLKKDGKIKSGQDQIQAVGAAINKMKKRAEAAKKGELLDEARRGEMKDKSSGIESDSQFRIKSLKVARDGNAYEHNLNETESTLKFGLFMLTVMYFRAMVFLRREKRSWSGDDDQIGQKSGGAAKDVVMSEERMRMLDEENKSNARKKKIDAILQRYKVGEQRRKEREAAERREAIVRLQAIVKRQKLEIDSVCSIQRVFRGHLGRKAAKRWALKKAELGAMHALLNAATICLQRVYRGYKARCYAIRKRIEMAQFISLMRAQEAAADESLYWETHPWQRFKRDQKEWMDKKFRKEHQIQVMGGARLTEEEQDRMLGSAMKELEEEDVDEYNAENDSDDGNKDIENASDDDDDEDDGDEGDGDKKDGDEDGDTNTKTA